MRKGCKATTISVLAVMAMLSGCKQDAVSVKDKSVEEVAKAVPAAARPLPGLYDNRIELVDVAMPGMAPQMQAQMKQAMSRSMKSSQYCLTEDQAKKGYEERIKQLASRPECKFDHYDLAGGKLDAKLVCTGDKGMKSTMTMLGTVSPEGSDMTMKTEQSGTPMPGGAGMVMTIHVLSKRVGDCPATPAPTAAG